MPFSGFLSPIPEEFDHVNFHCRRSVVTDPVVKAKGCQGHVTFAAWIHTYIYSIYIYIL